MDKLRCSVSLCVELKDAFTDKVIDGRECYVCVNGKPADVRKEGRYFIFLNMDMEKAEVEVKAPLYETCRYSVPPGKKRIVVPLYPNAQYPLPEGYERRLLQSAPGEEIRVIKEEQVYFLAKDYSGGEWLGVTLPETLCVEGMYFRIQKRNEEGFEDFQIMEKQGDSRYRIDHELSESYGRGSKISMLYCVRADEDGNAVIIVKKKPEEKE